MNLDLEEFDYGKEANVLGYTGWIMLGKKTQHMSLCSFLSVLGCFSNACLSPTPLIHPNLHNTSASSEDGTPYWQNEETDELSMEEPEEVRPRSFGSFSSFASFGSFGSFW